MQTAGTNLDHLWRAYGHELVAFARKRLCGQSRDGSDAEDVVQDVLVELLRRTRDMTNPRAYLYQAVRNRCTSLVTRTHTIANDPATFETHATHDNLDVVLLRWQIRDLLPTLTDRERIVLVNRLMLRRSLPEVTALLNLKTRRITADVVYELNFRLRDLLDEHAYPPEHDLDARRRAYVLAAVAATGDPVGVAAAYGICYRTCRSWHAAARD